MPTSLLVVVVALNAVFGQMMLKHALNTLGGRASIGFSTSFLIAAATAPWVYVSIAIQGLGYVLWMILMSREKMGVAAAGVGAGFYTMMPLCAWVVYGETLGLVQWLGIILLTVGITCIVLGHS